jgi:hypothetical protein
MQKRYFSFLLLFIVLMLQVSFAEAPWSLEKDKNGIKVWTRKPDNATLKEYKATTIMQISIDKLVAFFKDYRLYDQWMYKVEAGSVKLIKKNTENDFYIRMVVSAPLIKGRESITRFVFNKPDTKGTVLITLDAAPDLLPLNDLYVRIPKMKAYWKFTPLANGKTEITQQVLSSIGGNFPEAIANLGIVDAPYSMMERMKELLK